jgi:hypothetical protein
MKLKRIIPLFWVVSLGLPVAAQMLDLSDPNLKPGARSAQKTTRKVTEAVTQSSSPDGIYYVGKPLTATISKVRYLPREIFGQWNLSAQLLKTDDPSTYRPTMSEIWLLEKQGDQLVINNPVTGGHASIAVEKVEGKTAVLTREIQVDRRHSIQENFTIRVNGDTITGQSLHKVRTLKDGRIVRETFGLYQIEAHRIGQSSAQFRPKAAQDPDIEIEEVKFRH